MDADALRSVRNSFYLGFYDQVLKEAKQSENSKDISVYAQIYYYRALSFVRPEEVFKSISQSAPTALQAVKQFATYRTAADDNKELVMDTLKEWLSDEQVNKDVTLQLISAQLFFEQKNYKEALKLVAGANDNLEKLSLSVQIYLSIDRIDLANKSLKQMQDNDDDDILTQLASAWSNIAQGGEKVSEALFTLQDLLEKFGPSIYVLNGISVCEIHNKNYSNALSSLKQAKEQAVQNNQKASAETLINSILCFQHLRKTEIVPRILAELKQNYPNHPYLTKVNEMEQSFDKYASSYKTGKI